MRKPALLLAISLLGCGGPTGNGGTDMAMMPDASVAPDLAPALAFADFKAKFTAGVCKFAYDCCKPAELMNLGNSGFGKTRNECEAMLFDATFMGCAADIDTGRASLDATNAQACLDLLAKATCQGGINQFNGTACDNNANMTPMFRSNQGVGMACACSQAAPYGCKTGYCSNSTCTAYLAKGDACGNGVCDPATLYCAAGKCAPYITQGGDCSMDPNGCTLQSFCDPGSSKCTALLADGADCTAVGSLSCKSQNCDMNTQKCTSSAPPGNLCTGM